MASTLGWVCAALPESIEGLTGRTYVLDNRHASEGKWALRECRRDQP